MVFEWFGYTLCKTAEWPVPEAADVVLNFYTCYESVNDLYVMVPGEVWKRFK
jgi:hypothetical protein